MTYVLDHSVEEKAKSYFRKSLKESDHENDKYIAQQIEYLFPLDGGFVERFNLLEKFLEKKHYDSILVSGSAVGSELIVALQRGFKKAVGTEVSDFYIETTKIRFQNVKEAESILTRGVKIPFGKEKFSCIMSGHIIEHTMAPEEYLVEHFRVLKPGGIFYLEFPDRNHDIELHTGTPSYEKYPFLLRWIVLRYLSLFDFDPDRRKKFGSVLKTLVPVSVKDVIRWMDKNQIQYEVLYQGAPHPGFMRMIIRKN